MRGHLVFIASLIVLAFVWGYTFPHDSVHAQSFGISPIASTVGGCPPSASGQALLCAVGSSANYQWYQSFSGGAYTPLVSTPSLQGNLSACKTWSITASGPSFQGCAIQ